MNKREWMLRFVLENPFYEANNGDTIGTVGALYDAIVAATPEPTDEGKPYPEGRVVVRQRSGFEFETDSDDVF